MSKNIWRPVVNLQVANLNINSPVIANMAAGDHRVDTIEQLLTVGSYPPKGSKRPNVTILPKHDAVIAHVHSMEEKGSDVNLAAHLLNDAWNDRFDVAAVMSNDTDLVAPIRMVVAERRKPVYIICPGRWAAAPKLTNVASGVRHIRGAMLAASQFADPIPGTLISKPLTW
jgi:uncharacterized LabA/DUF88 family protein